MTLKISDDEDGHPRIEADGIAANDSRESR
jgi:hypothetical protein